MTINRIIAAVLGAGMALGVASCSEDDFNGLGAGKNTIVASIENPGQSRTAVDEQYMSEGIVALNWTDGDELGVFDANRTNHTKYVKITEGTVNEAEFGSTTGSSFMPKHAYYPYNANNDGKEATSLVGAVTAEQQVGTGNIPCDYKVGRMVDETNRFVFAHLFTLIRVDLDAAGTVMAGEPLEYVKLTAGTHNIAGDFTFSALSTGYSNLTNGSKSITLKWPEGTKLDKELKEYFTVLPTIQAGEALNFEIKTTNYTATFTAASKISFLRESLYNLPVNLLNIHKNYKVTVKDKDGNDVELEKGDTPQPGTLTGTFTCAALNVDGLPTRYNSGGPASEGTTKISQAAAKAGWDFFAVSEDFDFDTELKSALGAYNSGTYRKPGSWAGAVFGTLDTDGLNLFWKKDGIKAENEYMEAYNDKEGGLTGGANTCIKKGFRHYEVTVSEGVVIDVYITHMNTFSGNVDGSYYKAQMSQLAQLRDYVVKTAKANNRPAIIMGDTNMRYTRHAIKTQFIDVINSNKDLTVKDPWVEFHRPDYPTWGSKSLMINSKFYKDEKDKESGWYDTVNDICCADNNKGEVVDKIFYINVTGAPLQLKATSYKNEDSDYWLNTSKGTNGVESHDVTGIMYEDANFNVLENQSKTINKRWGLADHFPAVASFTWTLTK